MHAQLEHEGVRPMHVKHRVAVLVLAVVAMAGALRVHADVVTDANARAADIASKHPATPPAGRIMAILQASVFDADNPSTLPHVPTLLPAVPNWGKRKPWVMASGDQFRPAAPPKLTSETWTRDYNEVKAIGSKTSTHRTAEQTAVAKFWEATAPAVYWPVARSVASIPGRDVTANARLLALAGMAMDDGLIAVFDAKYTYNFWRPITA